MTPQEEEEIRTRAVHIADKIVSMDYFSAKLRWEYATALREGNFSAKTIMEAHSHLSEINLISTALLGLLENLPPTITPEPVPAPEKETTS